jgi:pimeloyl-ACP methyl ester carboxylesterase
MYSPGGFDATVEKWSSLGVYARVKLLDHLPKKFTCVMFDRRETGQSGGRVEAIKWDDYVAQGKGLLEHLGIERAHLMGGCMGCAPVAAFGVKHPQATMSMLLWWPVGGAKYRIKGQQRFAEHLAFVEQNSLAEVAALAQREGKAFGADPRGGPWASVLKTDADFAARFARLDPGQYKLTVMRMRDQLLDRDTAPGAQAEELLKLQIPALVVPGRDESHATSAARYLEECLPKSEYWDIPPDGQTADNAPARVMRFLDGVAA